MQNLQNLASLVKLWSKKNLINKAYFFDWVDDYISWNAVIGRTGYDLNVAWNVSTGSDADGSFFWINGNRDETVPSGSTADLASSTTLTLNQTTSFTFSVKFKMNGVIPSGGSMGLIGRNQVVSIYAENSAWSNQIKFRIRNGWSFTDVTYITSLSTAYTAHLVYDSAVNKMYCYINGLLQNSWWTTVAPATFGGTQVRYVWDRWVWGGTIKSTSVNIYFAGVCLGALTQAEINADIALGNVVRTDPRWVARYTPENLQFNSQYAQQVAFSNAVYTKWSGTTITDAVWTIYGVTADQVAWTWTSISVSKVTQDITAINGSTMASKTWQVKVRVMVASGTAQFRIRCTHLGVTDYYSSNFTATTTPQEFSFTQTFTSATNGTAIQIWLVCDSTNSAATLIVSRAVDLYQSSGWFAQTLWDESPNIGGYIGWKTRTVLSTWANLEMDSSEASDVWCLMLVPWFYLHIRSSDNKPIARYDNALAWHQAIATALGNWFRWTVHISAERKRNWSNWVINLYVNWELAATNTVSSTKRPPTTIYGTVAWAARKWSSYYNVYTRDQRVFLPNSFSAADALAIKNWLEPSDAIKISHLWPFPGESWTTAINKVDSNNNWTLNWWVLRKPI